MGLTSNQEKCILESFDQYTKRIRREARKGYVRRSRVTAIFKRLEGYLCIAHSDHIPESIKIEIKRLGEKQ